MLRHVEEIVRLAASALGLLVFSFAFLILAFCL